MNTEKLNGQLKNVRTYYASLKSNPNRIYGSIKKIERSERRAIKKLIRTFK